MNKKVLEILKGIVVTVVIFGSFALVSYVEGHDSRNAKVTDIKGSEIIVVDETDNVWSFYGDGYEVGQNVKLIVDNNHTYNKLSDDEIIKVK